MPVQDFPIDFYASHVSTLVIDARQLPFIVEDQKLMQTMCKSIKVLHIHHASNKHYNLLRYLIVMLQYRGVLEDIVLCESKQLDVENLRELLYILAGHAEPFVEEILHSLDKVVQNSVAAEKDSPVTNRESMKHVGSDLYSFDDDDNDGGEDGDADDGKSLDSELKDSKDDSNMSSKSHEENMLYDTVFSEKETSSMSTDVKEKASKSATSGMDKPGIYVRAPDEIPCVENMQKGLRGFALVSGQYKRSLHELRGELMKCFRMWPQLEKIALVSCGKFFIFQLHPTWSANRQKFITSLTICCMHLLPKTMF